MWQLQPTACAAYLLLTGLLGLSQFLGNLAGQQTAGIQLHHLCFLTSHAKAGIRLADDALILTDASERALDLLEVEHAQVVYVGAQEIGLAEVAADEAVNDAVFEEEAVGPGIGSPLSKALQGLGEVFAQLIHHELYGITILRCQQLLDTVPAQTGLAVDDIELY